MQYRANARNKDKKDTIDKKDKIDKEDKMGLILLICFINFIVIENI